MDGFGKTIDKGATNDTLVDLVRAKAPEYLGGTARSERVLAAMRAADRAAFLPEASRSGAYRDDALPIGFGQTCSQPSMVAFMLDELGIAPGHRVLEIGAGCGYASAIASRLCAPGGRLFAVEIVPDLADLARRNLGDGYPNLSILTGDGSVGLPDEAPFDRIFLSAGVTGGGFDEGVLLRQLLDEGVLLFPETHGSVFRISLDGDASRVRKYFGVSFVPLIGDNA